MHPSNPFGTTLPIIQAPMAGVQGTALAVAVSKAGGLGSLPCAMLSPAALESELLVLRTYPAGRFNLNFFCHTPAPPDAAREQAWAAQFAAYYAQWGVDAASAAQAPARLPFNRAMADLVCAFAPAVVSFHFGLPAPDLVAQVKRSGALVVSSATTVDEALWLQAHGADAIIAQGVEAGGHRGMFLTEDLTSQVSLGTLLPQVLAAVQVPVVAAGGIADTQGVAAVLAAGACAAQVGTAYLLCDEATTSPVHRAAVQSDAAHTTALTTVFTGRPARGIVNRMVRELGPISPLAPAFPTAATASLPLRQAAEGQGSGDFSPLWAGQNVSGCAAIPAGQMTRRLAGLESDQGLFT
jgi:nitronate monooxygenase